MDNIVEYLVFIFFLISILNGIFGKKKKKQREEARRRAAQEQAESQEQQPVAQQPAPAPKKDTAAILEELFGLKTQETPPPAQTTKIATDENAYSKAQSFEESWSPEQEFKNVFYEEPPVSKTRIVTPTKSVMIEPTDRIRASEKYQSIAGKVHINEKARAQKFKKRIKDPQTLKDYIIVQELLNEPKAFRM